MAGLPPSHHQITPLKAKANAAQKSVQKALSRSDGSWAFLWKTVRSSVSRTVTMAANASQCHIWIVEVAAGSAAVAAASWASRCNVAGS